MSAEIFPGPWSPIATVPRDGRVVVITDLDTASMPMFWNVTGTNHLVQDGPGIWEAIDGSITWSESRGYGPTHWKPYHGAVA